MTLSTNSSSPSSTSPACADVDRLAADYMAGVVSMHDAERIEQHAASCARCEARLLLLTTTSARAAATHFAPPVPATLRGETLTAVATAGAAHGRAMRWRVVGTTVSAAAAVIAVMFARGTPTVSSPSASPLATAPAAADAAVSSESVGASMLRAAEQLAQEQSRAEFVVLDAAAKELDAALARTPADAELRAYRAAVQARRSELAQRVRDVTL